MAVGQNQRARNKPSLDFVELNRFPFEEVDYGCRMDSVFMWFFALLEKEMPNRKTKNKTNAKFQKNQEQKSTQHRRKNRHKVQLPERVCCHKKTLFLPVLPPQKDQSRIFSQPPLPSFVGRTAKNSTAANPKTTYINNPNKNRFHLGTWGRRMPSLAISDTPGGASISLSLFLLPPRQPSAELSLPPPS